MTVADFINLVGEMRMAQKSYSKTRSYESLTKSKSLEKQVDELLSDRKKRLKQQEQIENEKLNPSLF